jgi:hypothetical protein
MQLTIDQALAIMRKLKVDFIACDHHYRGILNLDSVPVLVIHCSHGKGDLPGNVPHRFRKNLKLTVREFERLRDCYLSRDGYLALLRSRLKEWEG